MVGPSFYVLADYAKAAMLMYSGKEAGAGPHDARGRG